MVSALDVSTGSDAYIRVRKVSKPMKLIALRIDEEEKARLEQLAEERNVTRSRRFEKVPRCFSTIGGPGLTARGAGTVPF
jgi:hypothetical protein